VIGEYQPETASFYVARQTGRHAAGERVQMHDVRPFLVEDAFELTACNAIAVTVQTVQALVVGRNRKSVH
jgi:hypothetical protein